MEKTKFNPIVRWADNGKIINLTIELSDIQKDPFISITDTDMKFSGYGCGAMGERFYELDIKFYNKIDYKNCEYKITDRTVQFSLLKQYTKEAWPRLLKDKEKVPWLRIDFDKWNIEDSEEENMEEKIDKITFEQHIRTEIDKAKDDIKVFARISWLTMYNLFQAVCYTLIFIKLMYGYYSQGTDVISTYYDDVSDLLLSCQIAAVAEVIHPLVGIVKTSVLPPLIQVCGRSFILFVLVMPVSSMHANPVTFMLFAVYSLIEIVRYPFYLLTLYRINNGLINWLRYTIWIPLYPSGVICEVIILFQSLQQSEDVDRWKYPMPNVLNFYFSLAALIKLLLPSYILLSLYLMQHMWKLRCKKLGAAKRKEQKRD